MNQETEIRTIAENKATAISQFNSEKKLKELRLIQLSEKLQAGFEMQLVESQLNLINER
jgi:hypothetical protein